MPARLGQRRLLKKETKEACACSSFSLLGRKRDKFCLYQSRVQRTIQVCYDGMGQEEEEDERDDDGDEQRRGNPVALCNLLVDIFIYFSFQTVQPLLWSSRPSLAA